MKLLSVRTVLTPDITQIGLFEAKSGQQYSVYFRSADVKTAPNRTDHFFIVGLIAAFLRGEPFPLPAGIAESPGYLIARFEGMVLGLGRYYADGNFAGMVSRKWIPHLFDEGQRERQGIDPPLLPVP